jgi:signal transduction histidine kinase
MWAAAAAAAAVAVPPAVASPAAAAAPQLLGAASLGALIALLAVVVTLRVRARREIAAMRRALTTSAEWWWRTDARLLVRAVEPGRRRVAWFECGRLVGRAPWQLADRAGRAPEPIAVAIDARAPFFDVRLDTASAGHPECTILLSGGPIFTGTGGFAGYVGVATFHGNDSAADAGTGSEVDAGAVAPGVRVAHLEAEIAERTRQFDLAMAELDSFAHSVSHDLRAPLRVVDGFATIVLEDYGGRLDELGREHLKRIVAAGGRMNSMIDTLLALSRTTGREIEWQRVDLSRTARELSDELAVSDPARRVRFEIEPGLGADGDATLLRLVLQNLLGNAFKFTARSADARIEFGRREEEREGRRQAVYFVRDNGAGFDMRFADRLFGLFQRFHSQNEFPGTGVGLATVQRIVRKHGGRVWAESEPGKGATFYFTLWENGRAPDSPLSRHAGEG